MRRALLLVAASILVIGAGHPAASLLTAADLDPAQVLPPPPAPGSAQASAELAELRAIEKDRTPEMLAAALHDGKTKNASIFAAAIGPAFDLDKLPATARLMHEVREAEKDAADRAKDHFLRNRPWIVAPDLKGCGKDDDTPRSSYPSGHTTMAYSMGAVLARLMPDKAPAIMARSASYAQSRIVCEVHFRSDVTAGEALGLVVAERLMLKPRFRDEFAAAHAELAAAGAGDNMTRAIAKSHAASHNR